MWMLCLNPGLQGADGLSLGERWEVVSILVALICFPGHLCFR